MARARLASPSWPPRCASPWPMPGGAPHSTLLQRTEHATMSFDIDASEWLNTAEPLSLPALRGRVVLVTAFQMLCRGCATLSLPQARNLDPAAKRLGRVRIGIAQRGKFAFELFAFDLAAQRLGAGRGSLAGSLGQFALEPDALDLAPELFRRGVDLGLQRREFAL